MSELLNDISGETVLLGFSMYLRVLRYRPPSFAEEGMADPAVAYGAWILICRCSPVES